MHKGICVIVFQIFSHLFAKNCHLFANIAAYCKMVLFVFVHLMKGVKTLGAVRQKIRRNVFLHFALKMSNMQKKISYSELKLSMMRKYNHNTLIKASFISLLKYCVKTKRCSL